MIGRRGREGSGRTDREPIGRPAWSPSVRSPAAPLAIGLPLLALAFVSAIGGRPDGEARAASPAPASVAAVPSGPEVTRALETADATAGELLEEWIRIASTPSSSGQEQERAAIADNAMRAAGLDQVRRDSAGNVIGVLPGRDRAAKKVVFMAHMDTVALPGADFTIRREGGRLRGPGVRDDSSGLAAILAAARIARASGIAPPTDVILVASVQEETGLRGSQAFLKAMGRDVAAFVAVDGYLGQISYGATSILWTKMHFRAKGAHTLKSHENPSATLAAARAIEGIYAIEAPRRPDELESWINVGMIGGGEVPNAQARDAWFTVDLRSNDLATAADLEAKIAEVCGRAASEVGVSFEVETIQRLEGARIEGHRDSTIVRAARQSLDRLGWREVSVTPRGTADHNIAIQMGIPAIALGVTTGDGAHTPDEYADIAPYVTGVKHLILLMASPLI